MSTVVFIAFLSSASSGRGLQIRKAATLEEREKSGIGAVGIPFGIDGEKDQMDVVDVE